MLLQCTSHVCLCLLFLSQQVNGANVAQGAEASQVNTFELYTADIAVDGLKSDCTGSISFTHTETRNNPWWTVDLGKHFNIKKADVYIRNQGNYNSSGGTYRLLVGTHPYSKKPSSFKLCAEQTIGQSNRGTFDCGCIIGRYVTVVFKQNSRPLSLCEVEVFGTTNLALNAQASQMDTAYVYEGIKYNFTADRAVDGLKSSCGHSSRFTHTVSHNDPWLMVDLHEPFDINEVQVYVRDGGIAQGYRGTYRVLVGAYPYTTSSSSSNLCAERTIGQSNKGTFNCGSLVGRYVTVVFQKTTQPLCLCEVEVYGAPESASRDGCAAETRWIDKATLLMDAKHTAWPSTEFCRVQLPLALSGPVAEYEFTSRLYNIEPFIGHPGIMYNVQDLYNYDMLYFRPHSSVACYQTGYVEDGLAKWDGATSDACNGGAAPHNAWFTVKVKVVNGTTARLYKDGSLIATTYFHFSPTPKVGLNIPNRYGNKVKGDSFMLTTCLQDSI